MKNQKKPLVSIIIVNWNGGEVFKNCLASLAKIDYQNWELIVVDNGSTDNSKLKTQNLKLKLKTKNFRLIENTENVGFAKANNQGYEVTRGKYVLLLNNDTLVEPDFLTKLVVKAESDATIGVIQPKIFMLDKPGYLDNAGSFMTRIGFFYHWGFGEKDGPEFEKEREIFSAKGACMLIRREVIEKVGFFDPDFVSYFEESDFCWRVWLAGWRVLFYPEAKIYHKIGFTIRRLDVGKINFHYYKNRICALIKNLGNYNLFIILTAHLFVSLGISFIFFLRGNLLNSLLIIKAIGWNILNLKITRQKRDTVRKFRKLTDGEIFSKLMVPIDWVRFFNDFKRIEEDIKRKSS